MRIFIVLLFLLLFSCKTEFNPSGNFSSCSEPEYYIELYFKGDSIKASSHDGYVSNWRKFEFRQDTLYHDSFGEWKNTSAMVIKAKNQNEFSSYNIKTGITVNFKRIDESNIDSNDNEKLKVENRKRFMESECYSKLVEDKKDSELD